jgi:3-oxoacyl-[acyl-carrier protein] reductase
MMLKGKIALVTGGAHGIGAGIAEKFVRQGAHVFISDIDEPTGKETIARIGGSIDFVSMDISDEQQIASCIKTIVDAHGVIDILVNNAGVTNDKLLLRMTKEDWERVISVNLTGTFLVTKSVMRNMIKQRRGRIINIASIVGLIGNAGQSNYAASKAGIIGFTKSCAKELAGRNICVNAIAPGFIETRMTTALPDEIKQSYLSMIPMSRFGDIEDVANLALFLASDESSYITGQVICVDGGMVM